MWPPRHDTEARVTVLKGVCMKVVRIAEVVEVDATDAPIFTGGRVSRQSLIGEGVSESFNFNIVNFGPGARNRPHVHTSDQILFVTKGEGLVGADDEVAEVTVGDTVFIPAGERHWHGATDDSDFSHVALLTPDNSTEIVDSL